MSVTTEKARHIVVRLPDGARLPDAVLTVLRDEVVLCGWMRASGVLTEVKLRSLSGGADRALAGTARVVVLDGSVGLTQGDVTCGMRAVLVRETDTGLETIAGEIASARVSALEVMVTALDDIAAARVQDPSGAWVLEPSGDQRTAAAPAAKPAESAPAAWAETARASEPTAEPEKPAPPKPSPTFSAPAALPPRPVRPVVEEEDQVYPDAGDVVEHFAFGTCEVVKSDGDRLHVRLGKDGRIKEIALEMLRITPLDAADGQASRRFKLDRKM